MASYLLLAYDPIAVSGLVVAIIGVAVGIVAAVAAIYAAMYAKAAPTKEDLARVEANTEHLEEVRAGIASMNARLKKQEDVEQLQKRANRVSMAAMGNQSGTVPFDLMLSLREPKEPNLSLTHVELHNEQGNSFGSFPCATNGNQTLYRAAIPMDTMGSWFHAGTPDQLVQRRRLKLKVCMSMNGAEVSRDMAVVLIQMQQGAGYWGYTLNGSV